MWKNIKIYLYLCDMDLLEQNKLFIHNCDNMEYMAKIPDKYFEWICIDPPYGLGKRLSDGGGKLKDTPMAKLYKTKEWDVLPSEVFWKEVFRVSNNQIVFGANYFLEVTEFPTTDRGGNGYGSSGC